MKKINEAITALGFNPHKGENLGSGFMAGLLFACDIPWTIIGFMWNLLFYKMTNVSIRAIGGIAFSSVYNNPKSTFGSMIGFIFTGGLGIGTWFASKGQIAGVIDIPPQIAIFYVSCILGLIGIIATCYTNIIEHKRQYTS